MANNEKVENGVDSATNEMQKAVVSDSDLVTPWEVTSSSQAGVDYDKLLGKLQLLFVLMYSFV